MLSQIQERDTALQRAHDELEQRIVERTKELATTNKELEAFLILSPTTCEHPSGVSTALVKHCWKIILTNSIPPGGPPRTRTPCGTAHVRID